MNEHCAREDELLDLEPLQRLYKPARTLHGDLVIKRVRFTRDTKIGGEMNHGGDAIAEAPAHLVERRSDLLARA